MLLSSLFSWNHVHPVLVHFTTALLPVSLVSDGVGRFTDRYSLTPAAWWMLLYGAIATPLTALAGWMWATEIGGAAGSTLAIHKWLGLCLVFGFISLATWRGSVFFGGKKPGNFYFLFAAIVTAALMYQGYLGGKMTMG
ncbi:MAG: DUF2231 domain-containing protein [Pyrinomonadaceae bacterium]